MSFKDCSLLNIDNYMVVMVMLFWHLYGDDMEIQQQNMTQGQFLQSEKDSLAHYCQILKSKGSCNIAKLVQPNVSAGRPVIM